MGGLLDRARGYRPREVKNAFFPARGGGVAERGGRSLLARAGTLRLWTMPQRGGRSLLARALVLRPEFPRATPRAVPRRRRFPEFYGVPPVPARRGLSASLFGYIFHEVLISFFVAFLFFFFIFFVNQLLLVAQEIMAKKVPVYEVSLLILYALPSIVALAAPFGSLVGTLMAVGRLSSDNEILVMLSSGLPWRAVFLPAILAGTLVSLGSFVANDILLPLGSLQYTKLYRRILFSTPALELEANSIKRFRDTIIVTGGVSGKVIDDVLILDRTGDGERRLILAKKAELVDGGRVGLSLDLHEAFVQSSKEVSRRDYDYARAGFLRYFVPQEDFLQISSVSPREMSSRDVWRGIRQQEAALALQAEAQRQRILSSGMHLDNLLRESSETHQIRRERETQAVSLARNLEIERVYLHDRTVSNWWMEFHKKFSIPFGAFSFVFLSVSLGLLAKKSGQTTGFLIGSIIAVLYWAMLLGGQALGNARGFSPFLSMWVPNILALSTGFAMLLARVRR